MKTGQTTETGRTGRTGRSPLPWTKAGAEIESGPCPSSGTDAPAQMSESLGRSEAQTSETHRWVEEERFLLVRMRVRLCVSFVSLFMLKSDRGEGGGVVDNHYKPIFI